MPGLFEIFLVVSLAIGGAALVLTLAFAALYFVMYTVLWSLCFAYNLWRLR